MADDAYTMQTIIEVHHGGFEDVIEVRPDPLAANIIAIFALSDPVHDTGLRLAPAQARLLAAALVRVAVAIESAP